MGETQPTTPFPTPPPFYKYFTAQNLQQLSALRKQHDRDASEDAEAAPLDLTEPLRYLIPPKPPADGKWRAFGLQHSLDAADPSLEDANIPQLYPDHPSVKRAPQAYLIAMTRSLLTTFLSTCGILSQNPVLYKEEINALQDIVLNMHHLINQYRPHQARESMIMMLEEHIDKLKEEVKTIEALKIKTQESMLALASAQSGDIDAMQQDRVEASTVTAFTARDRHRQAWEALMALDEEEPAKDDSMTDAG